MDDDKAEKTVKIRAGPAAKKKNQSDGWEAEAESIVDDNPEQEETRNEDVDDDEATDTVDSEPEPESDNEDAIKGFEVSKESKKSKKLKKSKKPKVTIETPKAKEEADDEPTTATLTVGVARDEKDEEDEQDRENEGSEKGRDLDEPGDRDEDDENGLKRKAAGLGFLLDEKRREADSAPDDSEAVDDDKVGEDDGSESRSALLPAFMLNDEGFLDRRVIGAAVTVLLLLAASLLIYFVINQPRELTVPGERLGDEVTYKVNGNAYFKLYQGEINIPMLDGAIDESDMDFKGTLTLGTNSSREDITGGFHRSHETFSRRIIQDLEITGRSSRNDRTPTSWPPTNERSTQYSFIDTTSLLTIKLLSMHNLSYDMFHEELDWIMGKGIVYVQYASFSVFIPNPAMYNGPTLKEGDSGTYVPEDVESDAMIWSVSEGDEMLGHETLRVDIEPSTLPEGVSASKVSLWLSEASAYPLRINIRLDADMSLPIVGKLAEGNLRYKAEATDIKTGDEPVPSGTAKQPASDQKHKLAQEHDQFQPWSLDGAPRMGILPDSTGLDPTFDLQEAIDILKADNESVRDYLESKSNHYVIEAGFDVDGDTKEWNFTLGYQRDNSNKDIKAYSSRVDKVGNGTPEVVNTTRFDRNNPLLDNTTILELLTLGGAELVFEHNEHVANWALFDNGAGPGFDYSRELFYLRENPATPVANIGSLGSSLDNINYMSLINNYLDGKMDLDELYAELAEGQGGYGYVLARNDDTGYYTAVVDAESGALLGVGIVKQSDYT